MIKGDLSLVSQFGEVGLAFLQEGANSLDRVFGLQHDTVCPGDVLESLVDFLGLSAFDDLLDGVDTHWTLGSYDFGSFQQSYFQLSPVFKHS